MERNEKNIHCAIDGCRDGTDKKSSFALRALCLRLSFKRKARKKKHCAIDGCRDGKDRKFAFALRASFKSKSLKKMSLHVLWSLLGCKGKALQHSFSLRCTLRACF
jgi:hypothetical protein